MRVFRCLLVALVMLMFLAPGAVVAGIEPSPFEPELNKLHSIELNLAAIKKRMESRSAMVTLPAGTENYLLANGNQLGVLDNRLAEVLNALPYGTLDAQTKEEVVLALEGMLVDLTGSLLPGTVGETSNVINLVDNIVSRLGVGPSPFLPVLESLSSLRNRIENYLRMTPGSTGAN